MGMRRALLSATLALTTIGALAVSAALAGDSYQTLQYSMRQHLSDADAHTLGSILEAAKRGEPSLIRGQMESLSDPLARKIALWALIDTNASGMSYAELDGARRDLAGWPGAAKREAATERVIEGGGLGPQGIIDWFAGADPTTGEGAMALASALKATGQTDKARAVIEHAWRTKPFEADVQSQMLSRFGGFLTDDDNAAREDMLLYGAQGPAAHEMLALLKPDQKALAEARMAIRQGGNAESYLSELPAALRNSPGIGFEEAERAERRGADMEALALLPALPTAIPDPEGQTKMWRLRKPLLIAALKAGDSRLAYRAASDSGVDTGADGAEAEFYAGWIALTRFKDAKLADTHFAKLEKIGASPITVSRALYWRGRAAEAMQDTVNAQLFYEGAARYPTAFYGQLAAAKAGMATITLPKDPPITAADRARFEDREPIRAARLLADIGAKETFWSFTLSLASTLPSTEEGAELVDMVRGYGEQYLSMKIVREAAKHGFILAERGYPLRATPTGSGAEAAFILGITRQESGFDPKVRSGAGALGMMQLMPGTARIVARKGGYGAGSLEDADYNMQLGSAYLGQLVNQFSGSYVMAAAAYNAGPGRPTEWTAYCGDPRTSSTDPADYIECIPFSETRDYVMRVMEGVQIYRARLAGGTAKVTLPADLKRGGYSYNGQRTASLETVLGGGNTQ